MDDAPVSALMTDDDARVMGAPVRHDGRELALGALWRLQIGNADDDGAGILLCS